MNPFQMTVAVAAPRPRVQNLASMQYMQMMTLRSVRSLPLTVPTVVAALAMSVAVAVICKLVYSAGVVGGLDYRCRIGKYD